MENESYSMLWFQDTGQSDAILLPDWKWRTRNYAALSSQQAVTDSIEPLSVIYPDLTKLKYDYLSSGSLNIVSARFADALSTFTEIECIPISGLHQGKEYKAKQFYILHVMKRLDAMDRDKSIFTEWSEADGGGIHTFQKIVLNPDVTRNVPIFTLGEMGVPLFRNDVCQRLIHEGFQGLGFFPIEKYQSF